MKYVAAFVFLLLSFHAYADDAIIKDVVFEESDIDRLSEKFWYLKHDKRTEEEFKKAFPESMPLVVSIANVEPANSKRKYSLIFERGSYWCGAESCPLKIFNVTNDKKPKLVLELVVPPFIKTRECHTKFSFLFPSKSDGYISWVPGNEKLKPDQYYSNLDEAKKCD